MTGDGIDQDGLDLVPTQITAVWTSLLSQMTEQGATRQNVLQITVDTAQAIMLSTHDALWPVDQEVPANEQKYRDCFTSILREIAETQTALSPDPS